MNLRPYQLQAVADTSAAFQAGFRRVLVISATGSGKTILASKIIQIITAHGKRTLFVAHRRELILQTVAKLKTFGVHAGVIMAGVRPSTCDLVQVASIQTLARRDTATPDYVIVDEAHHLSATNSYGKLLIKFPHARVVGLTATPFRLDGQGLSDVFDTSVATPAPHELRDAGYLAPSSGWIYQSLDTSGVHTSRGDYDQRDLASLKNTILGDVVGEWCKHFRYNPVRTILFACGVKHSQEFVTAFRAAGVTAEHVDGNTPTAERDAILARVRSGETSVLSNCDVATEGFDLPELTCVILARPTKSLRLYLQQVGRVMRPAPGKTHAIIHDHARCIQTHGGPYDPAREYTLKTTKRDKPELTALTRCSECGAYNETKICPSCGTTAPAPPDRIPEVDLAVTAVALEDLERAQTTLSIARGQQRFRKVNDFLIGDYLRDEFLQGQYGMENRWYFNGSAGEFYIPAPKHLHSLLSEAAPKPGDTCRMTFIAESTKNGYTAKKFRLAIRRVNT